MSDANATALRVSLSGACTGTVAALDASAEEDEEEEGAKEEEVKGTAEGKGRGYDYLLGMALWC